MGSAPAPVTAAARASQAYIPGSPAGTRAAARSSGGPEVSDRFELLDVRQVLGPARSSLHRNQVLER